VGEAQGNGLLGIGRLVNEEWNQSIRSLIGNTAAISLLKERIAATHGLPVRTLSLRVEKGVWGTGWGAWKIKTPQMAMHHQLLGIAGSSGQRIRASLKNGLESQARLLQDFVMKNHLGDGPHFNH
jgi:hypothetical protein